MRKRRKLRSALCEKCHSNPVNMEIKDDKASFGFAAVCFECHPDQDYINEFWSRERDMMLLGMKVNLEKNSGVIDRSRD